MTIDTTKAAVEALTPYKFVRDMDNGNQMLPRADGTYYRRKDVEKLVATLEAERDAALAGAVKVKPLVWVKDGIGRDVASSILGIYLISKTGWGRASDRNETRADAPKAAAQADYEARIRAALEPDPERLAKERNLIDAAEAVLHDHNHGNGLEGHYTNRDRLEAAIAALKGGAA